MNRTGQGSGIGQKGGAHTINCGQVTSAKNWEKAVIDLKCTTLALGSGGSGWKAATVS